MEKRFVRFELENRYVCKEVKSSEMMNLGFFLATDVGCYSPTFKEMILDPTFDATWSNYVHLEKAENYILVGCNIDDDSPPLKIRRDELVKILDAWEQFCKTRPNEIIITQDGEIFNIEGKF